MIRGLIVGIVVCLLVISLIMDVGYVWLCILTGDDGFVDKAVIWLAVGITCLVVIIVMKLIDSIV